MVSALLLNSYSILKDDSILVIATLVLLIKVVVAPKFLSDIVKKGDLLLSVGTYFETALSLVFIVLITAVTYSQRFLPLVTIVYSNQAMLSAALSSIFVSLLLIINRKGALTQVIGILSLENSIVTFAIFAGLEQSVGLQIGIIFDIFVWLTIATVFVSMIYRHFGSLDVTFMKHLRD
ncbi:MAG: hypothetical protein HY225_04135 [Candidatus Vogelbacteria bacterium]|nr:hypothetical protein [Candidatus Vogelbacteria bacterium]